MRTMVIAIAATAVLATACGGSTASDDDGSEPAAARSADSTEPIRIGYVISDWTQLVTITGDETRDPPRDNRASEEEMQTLVEWANANGGVDGREIVATPYVIDQIAENDQLLAECTKITEDGQEDVIIDTSIFTNEDVWTCFANADVAYVGIVSSTDQAFVESVSPHVASTWPTLDRQMKALAQGMEEVGFLDGGTLGVLLMEDEKLMQSYEQVLLPALENLGVTPVTKTYISGDQASMNNAVLALKSEGVDRIVFEGTILDLGTMTAQAQAQNYHPRYAFSDYQAGVSVAATSGPPEQLRDSIAVSFLNTHANIANDNSRSSSDRTSPWSDSQLTPGMERCNEVMSEATGRDYANPGAAGAGPSLQLYCNNFMLWLESARQVGSEWTPEHFGDGLAELGTDYVSTQVNGTDFSEGAAGGPSDFRVGEYDESCRCFVAATDYLPLADD